MPAVEISIRESGGALVVQLSPVTTAGLGDEGAFMEKLLSVIPDIAAFRRLVFVFAPSRHGGAKQLAIIDSFVGLARRGFDVPEATPPTPVVTDDAMLRASVAEIIGSRVTALFETEEAAVEFVRAATA